MVDALLLTLARSEAAAGLILRMSREGTLNGVQSIVAVVLLATFAQCFANIAAIFKELGARTAIIIVAGDLPACPSSLHGGRARVPRAHAQGRCGLMNRR